MRDDIRRPDRSWSSERNFILSRYVYSHSQLVLESFGNNPSDIVRILFEGVERIEVYRSYKGGIALSEVDSHESYRQPPPHVRASLWEISSPSGTGFVAAGRVRVSRHSLEGAELELLFFAR
ncbi:hypothetical protein ORV05_08880 [Amycolatopsis cynarae]|uniref:Uncharacterized protein n=1 Tax=Amycolatopsis cynarae TaxID=2995223 RepID=A0ABY7BAZ2_9PSEU|nr:hypothetical protein [Amycolatopsis sp. HUAS 11-8]WAL67868.1 hypothetical protein ORV05_08880 [Amycolatopsis sp. HUAS 11-8]